MDHTFCSFQKLGLTENILVNHKITKNTDIDQVTGQCMPSIMLPFEYGNALEIWNFLVFDCLQQIHILRFVWNYYDIDSEAKI